MSSDSQQLSFFCCEINLTLITSEVSFPFHNLSYEVLHGTNEFDMFELGCILILGTNGALNSTDFQTLDFCTSPCEKTHFEVEMSNSEVPYHI